MRWTFFPRNKKITDGLLSVIKAFSECEHHISSQEHDLSSDKVLSIIRPKLEKIDYLVEKSKAKNDKVRVPVMYGEDGISELSFEVDAYNPYLKTVIEVEAGRAVTNYQFLKDFYEACCMIEAEYLCIAVRQIYRHSRDYQKVCDFFNSMYMSDRFIVPLKGILIIGY